MGSIFDARSHNFFSFDQDILVRVRVTFPNVNFRGLVLLKIDPPKRRSPAEQPPLLPLLLNAGRTPEERVVLHALLPEVLAVVPVLEVELNRVLVVALERGEEKEREKMHFEFLFEESLLDKEKCRGGKKRNKI